MRSTLPSGGLTTAMWSEPMMPTSSLPRCQMTPAGCEPTSAVQAGRAGGQVDRHQPPGALEGDIGEAAVRREGQVARLVRHAEAVEQGPGGGVVDVHLVPAEAGDHQVLAVRAVFHVVGIAEALAPLHLARRGVEEDQLVGAGIADHQLAAVGGEQEVVDLPQHGDPPHLLPRRAVEDADGGIAGVQHVDDVGPRRARQKQRERDEAGGEKAEPRASAAWGDASRVRREFSPAPGFGKTRYAQPWRRAELRPRHVLGSKRMATPFMQ